MVCESLALSQNDKLLKFTLPTSGTSIQSHIVRFPGANIGDREHKKSPDTVMLHFYQIICSWKTLSFSPNVQYIANL